MGKPPIQQLPILTLNLCTFGQYVLYCGGYTLSNITMIRVSWVTESVYLFVGLSLTSYLELAWRTLLTWLFVFELRFGSNIIAQPSCCIGLKTIARVHLAHSCSLFFIDDVPSLGILKASTMKWQKKANNTYFVIILSHVT